MLALAKPMEIRLNIDLPANNPAEFRYFTTQPGPKICEVCFALRLAYR
jgi:hypothetical protein